MKLRNGFVSNSSSSSFVISNEHFTESIVREYIQALLDAEKILNPEENVSLDDICSIYTVDDVDRMKMEGFNYGNSNEITLEQFKKMNGTEGPVPGVIVDSTGDNSIPWSIQSSLENMGSRFHWG